MNTQIRRGLLEDAGFKGKELDFWLRDGFSVLVNYHKLGHARLERLIYTYLGDWINTQRAELEQDIEGAEGRLVAALELILEGVPPYDIYVRWKPLHEQPIGWNPDLNDGVRLNIDFVGELVKPDNSTRISRFPEAQ